MTVETIGDYSGARPGGALLRRLGYGGVVRYVYHTDPAFNLSPAEVQDLKANGLQIGCVVERGNGRTYILSGDGATVALNAQSFAVNVGLADGLTYHAVDFDATMVGPTYPGSPGDNQMKQVARYFETAIGAVGESKVGIYGGYFVLMWMRQHGFNLMEWQTAAWSQGLIAQGCELFQHNTPAPNQIKDVDYDTSVVAYWGQRDVSRVPDSSHRFDWIANGPTIGYGSKIWLAVIALQRCLDRAIVPGHTPISVDGVFASETLATLEQYQRNRGLIVDGICGPQTWNDFKMLFLSRGYASV